VATRKPTSGTGKASGGTSGGKPAGTAGTSRAKKSEPVVLDPPKAEAAKPAKPAETIDVKAGDVTAERKDAPRPTEKPADPVTPPQAEAQKSEPPAAPPPAGSNRGVFGFAGLVAGGVVAAAIGYFAHDALTPAPDLTDHGAEIARIADGLEAQLTAQAAEITALQARVATLEEARAASPVARAEEDLAALKAALETQAAELGDRLAATEATLAGVLADLDASRARISETLSTAGGEISGEVAALLQKYDAEIEALKAQLADQMTLSDQTRARLDEVAATATEKLDAARERVSELTEQATEAARDIDMTLARERLKAAVESGRAYAAILAEVAEQAATDIPEALLKSADEGVATLPELQAAYPDAAREALKASIRAEAGEGTGNKLWAFVKSQVGARSLEERAGDDPDAILSRAEAALDRGDLRAAVDLVKTLPAAGIVEMSGWLARAEARLAVERALVEFGTGTE
jgi:hypothetical protein